MSRPLPHTPFTATAYLAWEAEQDTRSEFINGEVYAMAGGTADHNAATGATYATLRQHLKGKPCRAHVSDMKVLVEASNSFFYPDVMVSCSPTDPSDGKAQTMRLPTLIAEVLSPSTGLTATVELASVGWQGTVADLLA